MTHSLGALPPYMTLTGVFLSFLIPYILYKLNDKLRRIGDPPWKKRDDK